MTLKAHDKNRVQILDERKQVYAIVMFGGVSSAFRYADQKKYRHTLINYRQLNYLIPIDSRYLF